MLDTLEVTGRWAELEGIHAGVSAALRGQTDEVGCHFSHVYTTGAALYFTFTLRAADDVEAEAMYERAWGSALDACQAAGGSVAHHHGLGRLKAGRLASELDAGAAELMARIKAALDPGGILNPGVGLGVLPPPDTRPSCEDMRRGRTDVRRQP